MYFTNAFIKRKRWKKVWQSFYIVITIAFNVLLVHYSCTNMCENYVAHPEWSSYLWCTNLKPVWAIRCLRSKWCLNQSIDYIAAVECDLHFADLDVEICNMSCRLKMRWECNKNKKSLTIIIKFFFKSDLISKNVLVFSFLLKNRKWLSHPQKKTFEVRTKSF